MAESFPQSALHPCTVSVREAAAAVLAHDRTPHESFWRRWFDSPNERHFLDEVRAFIVALDGVLDTPPHELRHTDLAAIGTHIDPVVGRIEEYLEHVHTDPRGSQPLAMAIYAIRARHEDIVRRGARRPTA